MGRFISARESLIAPALIVLLFLLNLSIASRSPFGGWMDEVGYVDPGLNLAAGKGWESNDEFFSAGSPLYPGGLALWAHIFGIGMVQSRAYCYTIAAVALLLLWRGTVRFNLLTPAYRLFWILLLSTEYGMNWMERNERYDVWIFFGMALAWYGASQRSLVARCLLVFLGALIVPFAGFVGLPYVFLAAGLATLATGFKFWKEAFCALAGAVSGLVGVFLFYLAFGQLDAFRACLGRRTVGEEGPYRPPLKVFLYPLDDSGVILMILLLAALTFFYWKNRSPRARPWLVIGWGFVLLMPCIMLLRSVFVMMYFYMFIVPLTLALLQMIVLARDVPRSRYLVVGATILMATLCAGGLPARLYSSWKEWDVRDPQHRVDFVHTYLHPDDNVISEYDFYFELRDYVKVVSVPDYISSIPPEKARLVNVALLRDSEIPDAVKDPSGLRAIGGGWRKVAVYPPEEMRERLQVPARAHFTLYRRDVPAH